MDDFIVLLLEQVSGTVVAAIFLYAGVKIITVMAATLAEKSTREIERFKLVTEALLKCRGCQCSERRERDIDP